MVRPAILALLAVHGIAAAQAPPTWRVSARPILSIGSRDAVGPELFGSVAGVTRLSSGVIVVADGVARELRFFSPSGKHLSTSGRRGAGPGEFQTMHPVQRCAGDSLYVYDSTLFRISVFAPDGSFLRTLDLRKWTPSGLPPYEFWCNPAGSLAFVHRSAAPPPAAGPYRPAVQVSLVGSRDSVISLGTFPATERYFMAPNSGIRHLGKVTSIAIGSTALYLGTGEAFEVQKFSLRGKRLAPLREKRPSRPVTQRQIDTYLKEVVAGASNREDPAKYEEYFRSLEWPKAYPAYGSLKVDAADNLWIEEYPVPGSEQHSWTVYSETGKQIAVIALPRNFRLMEVGRDYLLGVWRDEFDVDYVRVYGLLK